MEERNRVLLETISDMMRRGDLAQAVTTVSGLHSADAAEVLVALEPEQEVGILLRMEPREAARALLEMDEPHQVEVAGRLKTGELRSLLESMPVDEAVDLLGDIPKPERERLLKLFGREEAGELEELLTYGDESAGGLMTPDYVAVSTRDTASEVIEMLRVVGRDVETIYYVYALSGEGILEGVLSLRELIISAPGRRVEQMMSTNVVSVRPDVDREEVAEQISRYDLLALPVTDEDGHMLGIVTVDDVMDVIDEEAEEDILKFAGAAGLEEDGGKGLFANIGRRLPWFILVVLLELLIAGGILKLGSDLWRQYVVLIFFIPLLVTMGGNIAVQSSTIMAHNLAEGGPASRRTLKAVGREVFWGVLVGLVTGGAVVCLNLAFRQPVSVGVAVGASLALTVVAASLVGCAMPVTIKALGRDPAIVSGPFIGTTMDILSLAIYLGVGRLLISV